MALNFPNTPNVGDTFGGPNNIVWQWDGTAWNAMSNAITDAPNDGKLYDRHNISWMSDPIQSDAPADGNFYTRHNNAWASGGSGGVPVGSVVMFGSATPPAGWLNCDGKTYLIANYAALYAVLGTAYGGDGVSTFAVPNYTDNFAYGGVAPGVLGGSPNVTLAAANLPSHTHSVPAHAHTSPAHNHGDPGHTHSLYDPGHSHGQGFVASYTAGLGSYNNMGTQTNTTAVGTGMSVYAAGTGIQAATVTINSYGPWNTDGGTGGGAAFSIMPSYQGINFIIRYA